MNTTPTTDEIKRMLTQGMTWDEIKFKSCCKDNMEFKAIVTTWQLDQIIAVRVKLFNPASFLKVSNSTPLKSVLFIVSQSPRNSTVFLFRIHSRLRQINQMSNPHNNRIRVGSLSIECSLSLAT